MGHLFNVDGISPSSMGLLTNVHSSIYWSGTALLAAPIPCIFTFAFRFSDGYVVGGLDPPCYSGEGFTDRSFRALAVRDGDIPPIFPSPPPPSS